MANPKRKRKQSPFVPSPITPCKLVTIQLLHLFRLIGIARLDTKNWVPASASQGVHQGLAAETESVSHLQARSRAHLDMIQ